MKTRIVEIGNIPLGSNFPVRVQSMTNTDTRNTENTAAQARALFEAGCDYVRITARNLSEAADLKFIKKRLKEDGFSNPLIADIHFDPEVALVAARIVEKVRINPGNYVTSGIDWAHAGEKEFDDEKDRIAERIRPLVKICSEYGTAIRIGTNYGSLSPRIMARYGNTVEGMVQSALEFTRILSSLGFHKLVLSMKASDIFVMVHAYRLLVDRMAEDGFDYPLHLGVTEAGAGDDGIIRSAAGIGTLLAEGIGDTIRVSLTGDPLSEVPVARKLAVMFEKRSPVNSLDEQKSLYNQYVYSRRAARSLKSIGGGYPVAIINDHVSGLEENDFLFVPNGKIQNSTTFSCNFLVPSRFWNNDVKNAFPLFNNIEDFQNNSNRSDVLNFITFDPDRISSQSLDIFRNDASTALVLDGGLFYEFSNARSLFNKLISSGCDVPVVLRAKNTVNDSDPLMGIVYLAFLLVDGLGDAIWFDAGRNEESMHVDEMVFSLMQVMGLRRTKAEFIACPTCGRTTYNVGKVLEELRLLASNKKHLKIAVMGCRVNGPGEMADADYGCVGAGPGKVTIYKGKKIIQRNVREEDAAVQIMNHIEKENV